MASQANRPDVVSTTSVGMGLAPHPARLPRDGNRMEASPIPTERLGGD